MLNGNRIKVLQIFALGLCSLICIQEASCGAVASSNPDVLPISRVADHVVLSKEKDPVAPDPFATTAPGIFKENIFCSYHRKQVCYIDIWEYLNAPDADIAGLNVEQAFLTGFDKVELSVKNGELLAKRARKEKVPGSTAKEVEEVLVVRNLEKKNSHVKTLCLQYADASMNLFKGLFRIYFGKKIDLERVGLLLSLVHHHFDALEAVYLSLLQGSSEKLRRVFKERNIQLEGGMPTLRSIFIRGPEFGPEGYVGDFYGLEPVLIMTKYVLQDENFDQAICGMSTSTEDTGCKETHQNAAALKPTNGETIKQKLDSEKCDICKLPFRDEKTGVYVEKFIITKCRKIFHHRCVHSQVMSGSQGSNSGVDICCSSCNTSICDRRMYYKVTRHRDADCNAKYSLVLMRFRKIIWDKKVVKYDQRPNYTIRIFLGPLVPSGAAVKSPNAGNESPASQEKSA